jgi:hypothetical protein
MSSFSNIRKFMLVAASVCFCIYLLIFIYVGGLGKLLETAYTLPLATYCLFQLPLSAISAIVIVELVRVGLVTGGWSGRRHFTVVLAIWLSLFALALFTMAYWRASAM